MELVEQHPFLERVLEDWAPALGSARLPYGRHAYRVLNYARALLGSAEHDQALALAAAFHDLGIWSDRTFDYLPPSAERAEAFRRERAPGLGADLIAGLIRNHHVLTPLTTGPEPAVQDAFRLADRVDVSRGQLRAGLSPRLVREVVTRFPYSGFHGVLVRTALAWAVRHPLRPLPMVRLR
jgi:hypothetical protein